MRAAVLVPLLLATLRLAAQESLFLHASSPTRPGDRTQVEATALFSMPAPSGYLPVRVTIQNQRESRGTARLDFTSSQGYGDDSTETTSSFEITAEAQSTETRDLLVPLGTAYELGAYQQPSVEVDLRGSFGSTSGSMTNAFFEGSHAVLLGEKLFTPNASALDSELNSSASSSGRGSGRFAARFTARDLPSDWRAYSGYDALLITDDEWRDAPPGARNAILQWVRLGNTLEIHHRGATFSTLGIEPDAAVLERSRSTVQADASASYGYGRILLREIGPGLDLDAAEVVRRFRPDADETLAHSIFDHFSGSWPLHQSFGSQSFNYALFIIVLIAFGVLVGPVNLFVFARSGQRHRLFVTTPLIALGTSALLILLIFVQDGLGGRGERVVLMEVRPETGENNAYVHQEQISRTGVLLGSSFTLREDAAIAAVPIEDNPWARLTPHSGGDSRFTMNFTDDGLRVSGDWFQSRSEQGQLVRAVVPTRGRIELRNTSGAPVLLSTFEFPIGKIYYKVRSNTYWLAEDLQPGTAVTAREIDETEYLRATADACRTLNERHREFLQSAAGRPDHYVALTTDAPAIDTFDAIRWKSTTTYLTGPVVTP